VLLTDGHPLVVEQLAGQVRRNGLELGRDVVVAELDWRAPDRCEPLAELGGFVELVVGADLLYLETEPLFGDLLKTLTFLCRHGRRGGMGRGGRTRPATTPSGGGASAAAPSESAAAAAGAPGGQAASPPLPPCRVVLVWGPRAGAKDLGIPFLALARAAGFKVEGPLECLPEELYRWDVAKGPGKEGAEVEHVQVFHGIYKIVLLTRAGEDDEAGGGECGG
jgi:hypothetical protein